MTQFTQRALCLLAVVVCNLPWQAAWSQQYPGKPVRIIALLMMSNTHTLNSKITWFVARDSLSVNRRAARG